MFATIDYCIPAVVSVNLVLSTHACTLITRIPYTCMIQLHGISCDRIEDVTDSNDILVCLFYNNSRQYVGKNVHESLRNAAGYILFWFTLLAWKMYFSYQYEVKILVLPTVELFDDYINFQVTSLV